MLPMKERTIQTLVVGSGAAGFHGALRLHQFGVRDLAIVTEDVHAGTSRNTGSDKQTYYKLSLAGSEPDSVRALAEDLFRGQCVDGDHALCEAALSTKCFYHLIELGVPFPDNEFGEYIGYKTDHDRGRRASSVGPYTSRIMTECLEKAAADRQIPILDQCQAIRLLVRDDQLQGLLCLRQTPSGPEFLLIWCRHIILATGGPAGMYHDSVYPVSQLGASGMAFAAGIRGKNLTEWQFGMASLNPRWNVSGTYMQVLPRFVSTAPDGSDEREFLTEHFSDPAQMLGLVFLKGYQWPFDTAKIWGGSSLIDLLVYQETILRGRRVFLDFTRNPCGGTIDFDALPAEAHDYLRSAGSCFGTPIDRLEKMNHPAVAFYREHGVDLHRQKLEIAICAQHNNGGLSIDENWQTNIKGVYAAGEAAGSHGVTRPGGSALNAGQAGSLRAAEHIAYVAAKEPPVQTEADRAFCRRQAEEYAGLLRLSEQSNLDALWDHAARRMSGCGGMIRSLEAIGQALCQVDRELAAFPETAQISSVSQAGQFFRLHDMLTSQKVYLSAMADYIRQGGGSRGSALYTDPAGEKPAESLPELYRCRLDGGAHGSVTQEAALVAGQCRLTWRPVRPLPEPDYFFENQWRAFRQRRQLDPPETNN